MALQTIDLGAGADTQTGDTLFQSNTKVLSNFAEIYSRLGDGTNLPDLGTGDSLLLTAAEKALMALITVTNEVNLDTMKARVDDLDATVVLQGAWDASGGSFPGGGTARSGHSYIVTVGGTVDEVAFNPNDRIVAIADNAASGTYEANWLKLDYTDAVLRVAGLEGDISPADLRSALSVVTAAFLASTAAGQGASQIGVQDTEGNFPGNQNVEGALLVLANSIDAVNQLVVNNYLTASNSEIKRRVAVQDGAGDPTTQRTAGATMNIWRNWLGTSVGYDKPVGATPSDQYELPQGWFKPMDVTASRVITNNDSGPVLTFLPGQSEVTLTFQVEAEEVIQYGSTLRPALVVMNTSGNDQNFQAPAGFSINGVNNARITIPTGGGGVFFRYGTDLYGYAGAGGSV